MLQGIYQIWFEIHFLHRDEKPNDFSRKTCPCRFDRGKKGARAHAYPVVFLLPFSFIPFCRAEVWNISVTHEWGEPVGPKSQLQVRQASSI